jgi:hypothetical protein
VFPALEQLVQVDLALAGVEADHLQRVLQLANLGRQLVDLLRLVL